MTNIREKDLQIWNRWRKDPSKDSTNKLLKQFSPLINSEVNRWKGTLSPILLEAEGKKLALEAAETFNPKFNVPVSIHVMNHLKKISRINYTFQNIARIPEHRVMRLSSFQKSEDELTNQLGRIPSTAELADHLSWPQKEVSRIKRDFRKELIGSEPVQPNYFPQEDDEEKKVTFIYHSLTPQEQSLFESVTGFNNSPILSTKDIQKRFKWTNNQLNYRKKQLTKKIQSLNV